MDRRPPLRHSWLSSEHPVARLLARPVRIFLNTEAAGGLILVGAVAAALLWANSAAGDTYRSLWRTEINASIGSFTIGEDLRHWINDGFMTLFFFVVGLEIKRELVAGELNDVRKALLPVIAALGGMLLPAVIYLGINGEARGWGVPIATDIALALGVLALLGPLIPNGLKVFVLSLAIVDDIGAILVIALFYAGDLHLDWLAAAGGGLLVVVALRRLRVFWVPVYAVVGAAIWFATWESGVHATLAGVALGLLTPARPSDPGGFSDIIEGTSDLTVEPDAESVRALTLQANEVVSVAERLEHLLHPWTSYVIVPLFALANAGIVLSGGNIGDALGSRITWAIVGGLVIGKLVGIAGISWLAVRLGLGRLPEGVSWRHMIGGGAVAGIGFTVSLFIAGLAFSDAVAIEAAKVGIFLGSIVAGIVGVIVLRRSAGVGGG